VNDAAHEGRFPTSLAAEGVGEVELRCVTPDGEQVVTLKEVYYIPEIAVNLFSVRRATEKGAEVYLSKERCYVKYEGTVVMQAKGVKCQSAHSILKFVPLC
jgi:hypothetical protein